MTNIERKQIEIDVAEKIIAEIDSYIFDVELALFNAEEDNDAEENYFAKRALEVADFKYKVACEMLADIKALLDKRF